MIKNLLLFFLILLPFIGKAQNCTVNANVDQTICRNEPMILVGSRSGLLRLPATTTWSQVAGPSVVIASPNSLTTAVTGFNANQTYTFRLSTTCRDGVRIFDDVRVSVLPITIANAGPDQTACPGTSTLAANAPGVNESGNWVIVGANNAGVTINNATQRNSTFTTSTTAAGTSTLRWTLTNTNTCSSFDDVIITNYGGFSPVSTNVNFVTLGNCYSTTQCYNLNATFGGGGLGGQQGTWSQVSGPSNVTFSNVNANNSSVCGLSTGCYKLRWTVAGPCVQGTDTIRICVPPPTQNVTGASSSNQIFCDGRTVAFLTGNAPVYTGETVTWAQIGGPTSVTFSNANSPTTTVSNLNGSGTYSFTYTITNPLTGCSSSTSVSISYATAPTLAPINDTILPCNVTSVSFPFSASGGNATSYSIISAPAAWGTAPTPEFTTNSPIILTGLTTAGTYIVRVRRTTSGGVSCADVTRDVRIIISRAALGANAGTPQFLPCNVNSTNLAGNVPARGFGTWSLVSGPSAVTINDIYDPNTQVDGFIRGTYVFKWVINSGPRCPKAEATVRVIFAPTTPQAVAAGSNRTVCFGGTILLDGSTPAQGETGTWSLVSGSGITFADVNNPRTGITGTVANTTYVFKWKVTNLCGADSSTVTITTSNLQGPPQANAGADACFASGTTSLTLAGNNPNPATGLWTQISGPSATITNNTLFNSTVTGLTNGTYLFEWQNNRNSCDPTRDTVRYTISGSASAANAGTDRDSCGNSVTLGATPVVTGLGTWVQVSGSGGWSINNVNSPIARITGLVSGEYKFAWVVTNGACSGSSDTVTVNIDNVPSPAITAGASVKLCGGNTLTLTGNRTNSLAIWSLFGAAPNSPTIVDADSGTTVVNGLITGIYNFKRTSYSTMGICPNTEVFVSDTVVISSNAGADQSFCFQSTTSLLGPVGSIGTWTQTLGGAATVTTTSNNSAVVTGMNPAGSPYRFAFTVPTRWGCPQTTDTMIVLISDTTVVPRAGRDSSICNATSFQLTGNNLTPSTGLWSQSFGPSATITTPTNSSTTVTGVTYGIYLFLWTATNGTCSRADEVRVTNFEAPTTANAGADSTICPTFMRMRGNTAAIGVGNWRQVSGPITANIEEQVNPRSRISGMTATGTYRFIWEITNGPTCPPSIDTIAIFVPSLNPTTANAGIDSAICNRTVTQLNGNNPSVGTGNWSQYTLTPTSTIASSSSFNSGLTLSTFGTFGYVWTTTNGACVSRDTVVYRMSALPTPSNAGPRINSCIGQPVNLNGNNPSSGVGTWRQTAGPFPVGFVDSLNRNTGVLGIDTGTYIFRWSIANGSCPASNGFDTVVIVRIPAIAIAGAFQSLCGSTTTLSGSQDSVGTGQWSFVSGPNSPTIVTPNNRNTAITGLTNGNYRFRWAITNGGCVSQDTVPITYVMPLVNNACTNADSLYIGGGLNSGVDSLCASTAEVGEPATCGLPACNSNMYKFVTNNTPFWETATFNFTVTGNPCPNGLRVSCFNSGACPSLGSQMGSCQAIPSSGGSASFLLAPNTLYYLVVDDNSPTCGTSNCRYEINATGNALPLSIINFDAKLLDNSKTKLTWQSTSSNITKEYKIERKIGNSITFVNIGKVASNKNLGLSNYQYIDNIATLPNERIYYRILEVEENGELFYTNVKSVLKTYTIFNSVNVYPNPNEGSFNVSYNLNEIANVEITITDNLGKIVYTNILDSKDGVNTFNINNLNLTNGIYNFNLNALNYNYNNKIVIIK